MHGNTGRYLQFCAPRLLQGAVSGRVSAAARVRPWHDTFSILLARGRAQVSVVASRGDWPKRTQDQAYSDQNHASAA